MRWDAEFCGRVNLGVAGFFFRSAGVLVRGLDGVLGGFEFCVFL